ncbi:hypothetical protein ACH3O9_15370 [Leeuwenhoekiella sp. A16]|uniref:hypothetical protein n=1 Tax=unclassified Leeuwenhoekiella TaxID=2615029 RepID=UPI003A80FC40|tara:strand:- start:198 stop:401 length:204 start_codon:yes stop_codon:yes gene_type:complete
MTKQRIKIFIITFLSTGIFTFGFYYLDTHKVVNSIFLGVIGGSVLASLAALLIPFVRKGDKQDHDAF